MSEGLWRPNTRLVFPLYNQSCQSANRLKPDTKSLDCSWDFLGLNLGCWRQGTRLPNLASVFAFFFSIWMWSSIRPLKAGLKGSRAPRRTRNYKWDGSASHGLTVSKTHSAGISGDKRRVLLKKLFESFFSLVLLFFQTHHSDLSGIQGMRANHLEEKVKRSHL